MGIRIRKLKSRLTKKHYKTVWCVCPKMKIKHGSVESHGKCFCSRNGKSDPNMVIDRLLVTPES